MARARNERLRIAVRALWEQGYRTPREIWRKLGERGYRYSLSYIRTLLWRMRREGELPRPDPVAEACMKLEVALEKVKSVAASLYGTGDPAFSALEEAAVSIKSALNALYSLRRE